MVQVLYKKRRLRTELPAGKQRGGSATAERASTPGRQRALHLRQFGVVGERSQLLDRMQNELDALQQKPPPSQADEIVIDLDSTDSD